MRVMHVDDLQNKEGDDIYDLSFGEEKLLNLFSFDDEAVNLSVLGRTANELFEHETLEFKKNNL